MDLKDSIPSHVSKQPCVWHEEPAEMLASTSQII